MGTEGFMMWARLLNAYFTIRGINITPADAMRMFDLAAMALDATERQKAATSVSKPSRGRPKGTKTGKRRGRPPGSKNKPKDNRPLVMKARGRKGPKAVEATSD